MISLLRDLSSFVDKNTKRKFIAIQLLLVTMAIIESLTVLSVGPFMAIVGNQELIQTNELYKYGLELSNLRDPAQFTILVGVFVILLLSLSTIISTYTVWKITMFAAKLGGEIANRLFSFYIAKPWLFHTENDSSKLTNNLNHECNRISFGILINILQLNTKFILALVMVTAVAIYNPIVAISGSLIFSLSYFIFFRIFRFKLDSLGKSLLETSEDRFKTMSEAFSGIRDIKIYSQEDKFINSFNSYTNEYALSRGSIDFLAMVPKYLMELVAFGSMIGLAIFLIINDQFLFLPTISVFALAGLRLLPAFQQIYTSLSIIKANEAAISVLKSDLKESLEVENKHSSDVSKGMDTVNDITFNDEIRFEKLTFSYPTSSKPVLNEITFSIEIGKSIGIIGPSGSGKSTLLDVISGLIIPQSGSIIFDKKHHNIRDISNLNKKLGFVGQNVFLLNSTVKENILFGSRAPLTKDRLSEIISQAQLGNLIKRLPNGIDTFIGERGVQLSGGERQRISIARALANEDVKILIFDEATSALDGKTEERILDCIYSLQHNKTIIFVAHRLNTVSRCSKILLLDNGIVKDSGSFKEIYERNMDFMIQSKLFENDD